MTAEELRTIHPAEGRRPGISNELPTGTVPKVAIGMCLVCVVQGEQASRKMSVLLGFRLVMAASMNEESLPSTW